MRRRCQKADADASLPTDAASREMSLSKYIKLVLRTCDGVADYHKRVGPLAAAQSRSERRPGLGGPQEPPGALAVGC